MISAFVQEQKRYTREEIKKIMSSSDILCSDSDTTRIIKKLKSYGILKTVKQSPEQLDMTDLIDTDIEVVDEDDIRRKRLYVFTFVGVIMVEGRVLKCYPKYLFNNRQPVDELCQILRVLRKYNAKKQIINLYNDGTGEKSLNRLAVLVSLLEDYFENGIYTNTQEIFETNGNGEIHWGRTQETTPISIDDQLFYTELKTRKRVNDDDNFIKKVHECVLTRSSCELSDADMLNLLEIEGVFLTENKLSDLGDEDYILTQLEKEINVLFNTRKQNLLKLLIAIIEDKSSLDDLDSFNLYGTNSFNLVWEEVCADVFDNKLKTKLRHLELTRDLALEYQERKDETLQSIIEKPLWRPIGTEQEIEASDTLTPDLISISKVDDVDVFIFFDAKYYNLQLEIEKPLQGNPGVGDITKQYLYQLAYKVFIEAHQIAVVKNCFLMPTEGMEIINKGIVRMPMLETLGLEDIQIRLMPAKMMYDYYLHRKKLDVGLLKL